jgi:N-acetylmuramoyl-L-alanine amidase
MSKFIYLIDAGHGGVDASGNYTTPAKLNKRFKFPDGFEVLEGVSNRLLAKEIWQLLMREGIEFKLVYDEIQDWPLAQRVNLANRLQQKHKRCIYISIHSNAGKGTGFEVFTSPGQTVSDKYAELLCTLLEQKFKGRFPFRKDLADSDKDKEAKFTVLTETTCPSILVEYLFFDNRKDADFLMSVQGRKELAEITVEWIKQIETL